jgi:hypothetical protein
MTDINQLRAELETRFDSFGQVLKTLSTLGDGRPSPRLTDLQNQLEQQRARPRGALIFTISIVGQIKTGKSTLADVLFFHGRDVLPSGPTPTTAALTQIDYRATDSDVAQIHYYSAEDWRRIEELAAKFAGERKLFGSDEDDPVARGCAEIVERIRKARIDARAWLGTRQDVPLADLARHIGPNSDHAALIHHIQLYTSEPLLEGFRVVDTPGLNDTVFSREKITRDSLNAADCVLFLSKASQFLDATDVGMLQTLADLGVQQHEVLASMFDQAEGDPAELLRDFQARLAREAGLQRAVLPASPLLAKLHAKLSRSDQMNEDEVWYLEHPRRTPEQLLAESRIEPLRQHIHELVASARQTMAETLRRRCDSLAKAIANLIKQAIRQNEIRLENLQENEEAIKEELAKLDATRRVLRMKVLQPHADQVLRKFQSSWKDFADGIEARIKKSIDDVSAVPDKWGNKNKHQRVLDRNRKVLDDHFARRESQLSMDGEQELTYLALKNRVAHTIEAEPVATPLIVEALTDHLASSMAQILSELFAGAAGTAYNPDKISTTNEPAYQTMTETISGTSFKVNLSEREKILKAWRDLRTKWAAAASNPVTPTEFQRQLSGFFETIFDPAFDSEVRRANLGPEEKKAKLAELQRDLNDLRAALDVVESPEP